MTSTTHQRATLDADALAARLADELARRWRSGERPPAEEFLDRAPELWHQPEAAAQLVYEEICQRQEAGETDADEQVLRRFPQWRGPLRVLLDCHRLLEPELAEPLFPAAGETLEDFELLAELGRGALGRVFLAREPALADRPVVLKLTPRGGGEHLSLARLQHTYIVPLYGARDLPDRRLRLLCMPYLGGATVAQILLHLQPVPVGQRAGRHLLDALDAAQGQQPVALPCRGPHRQALAGDSYVRAVCRIGVCLAEALHYAHERGLVHLDLKPSNVLLAADGQPMLLDFHLARAPLQPDSPAPEWFGGTLEYMSPEQQQALAAVREGRAVPVAVDGRSDVYSLGLLLHELLAGVAAGSSPRRLHRRNRQVGRGLSDLVQRCLEADPDRRLPSAAALAEDLRRHLADQPLRHVRNRSLGERWAKWRRRRPHALAVAGLSALVVAAVLAAGALAVFQVRQRYAGAEAALEEGRAHAEQLDYAQAAAVLERGRALAEGLPGGPAPRLDAELGRVKQAQAAEELHRVADRIRFRLAAADALAAGELRRLEGACDQVWERRQTIRAHLAADAPPEARQRVEADLLDLAILGADLHVRLAPPGGAELARREALARLQEAEELFGSRDILYRERRFYAEALGLGDESDPGSAALLPAARTAWEHLAVGRLLLRGGDHPRAAEAFARAVDLEPQQFWPNFYEGLCAFRRQRYEEATAAFGVCVALAPRQAECYYNRGRAHAALRRFDQARRDYDRALALDETLSAAALNRGLLHLQAGRHTEAVADLERALAHGAEPAAVHYGLALAEDGRGRRSAALEHVREVRRHDPGHKDAAALEARLLQFQPRRSGS